MPSIGRLRSMCTAAAISMSSSRWSTSGRKRAGSRSSCSRNTPSLVILPLAWRSAEHDTAIATGQLAPWRGRRTMRTSWQKYLPPNWAPMPVCWARSSTLRSSSTSRKPCPARRALRREGVEVVRRGQLGGLHGELGRRPADDDGEVVRRARRRAERLHLLEDPRQQRRLVEQRLGLLVEVRLVGAAAALGDEQELVLVAVDGGDLDLGRQVGAGVLLLVHRERRHLAVAQVRREVGLLDPGGDRRLVAAAGEHELALLALDDRGAGVLAHRQHAAGGDRGVLQQVEGDEPVVLAGLGIVEDLAQLGQVLGAQEVGDVVHRLGGERRDGARLDLEERARRRLERRHALRGDEPVGGGVGTEREELGVRGGECG